MSNKLFWIIAVMAGVLAILDIHSYHLQRDLDIRSKNIEQHLLYIELELDRLEQNINAGTSTN